MPDFESDDPTRLSAYDYHLPESLIAQQPAEPRDSARLLVVHRNNGHRNDGHFEHRRFSDLPEYLTSGDMIVVNDTKVMKARLLGKRIDDSGQEGGKVEFVLLEEQAPRVWEGLFHASVKHRPGVCFFIPTPDGRGLRGRLIRGASDSPHGTVAVEFDRDPIESGAGEVPLPKYIKRAEKETHDEQDYQTIYAERFGSAAAPTAGLHFTPAVVERLRAKGVGWTQLTLHVGLGTFRPVKDEDVRRHVMHEERYEISAGVAEAVARTHREGRRVIAVGTTSVRSLESAWRAGEVRAGAGRTSLFIYPGSQTFRAVDAMITNFHLPKSTLLMLVCAFAGRELALRAYEEAVREEYRFFSYGDAMLIL